MAEPKLCPECGTRETWDHETRSHVCPDCRRRRLEVEHRAKLRDVVATTKAALAAERARAERAEALLEQKHYAYQEAVEAERNKARSAGEFADEKAREVRRLREQIANYLERPSVQRAERAEAEAERLRAALGKGTRTMRNILEFPESYYRFEAGRRWLNEAEALMYGPDDKEAQADD